MKNLFTILFSVLMCTSVMAQQTNDYTINVNGEIREYTVYIPSSYDGTEEYPCVYSFHSYYTLMSSWLTKFDIRPLAEVENFIVIYPKGKVVNLNYNPSNGPNTGLGWNTGSITSSNTDDVGFIEILYDHILTQFEIDDNRIYAYGHGIGGNFAHRVTSVMEDKFAAVAAVSVADTMESTQVIPTLFMKGTASFFWPEEGVPGIYPSFQEILENKVSVNNCNPNPIVYKVPDTCTTDDSSVEIYSYVDGDDRSEVVYYKIIDGGYAYPGQAPLSAAGAIAGPVNNDIDANTEIWKFFKRHIRDFDPHPELVQHSVQVGLNNRPYYLYIPDSYDGSEDWPLIVSFHPYYTLIETWMRKYDMRAIADSAKFLIAFPQGGVVNLNLPVTGAPMTGYGWNLEGICSSNNDDETYSLTVLDDIQSNYSIDESRVYTVGFSIGGAMAHRMAILHPDKIAATASVSLLDTTSMTSPFPLFYMHGSEDDVLPLNGLPGVYPSINELLEKHLELADCDMNPVITPLENSNYVDSSVVDVYEYTGCNPNQDVVYYEIVGGNHSWPGQIPLNSGDVNNRINRDINAGAEIWKFLRLYSLESVNKINNDSELLHNLVLYPNPVKDELNFVLNLEESNALNISVFNALGVKVLHHSESNPGSGKQLIQLAGLNLNRGVYFVRVQSGNAVVTRSIVVN